MGKASAIERRFIEDCFVSEEVCLIFADWLEEQGREDEAAFFRDLTGESGYSDVDIAVDGYGCGYGDSYGDSYGDGDGYGYGYGSGSGDGDSYVAVDGYGDSYGDSYGDGDGYGYGYGSGSGDGSGDG